MTPELTVLCVTRGEDRCLLRLDEMYALTAGLDAEFVLAVDTPEKIGMLRDRFSLQKVVAVKSSGFIEGVLDEALSHCTGRYVLRLDDDEQCSIEMMNWLVKRRYRAADHWKFPRVWLTRCGRMATAPWWPDDQTRLSVKSKAGGLRGIHSGSPFGGGRLAPVAIEHYTLAEETLEQRRARVARYEALQRGSGFPHFYLPEDTGGQSESWSRGIERALWAEQALRAAGELGYQAAQYPDEIIDCAAWLLSRGPIHTVLEIGTHQGGTAAFWCELADRVISVDLPDGRFGGFPWDFSVERNRNLQQHYPGIFEGILGDSHCRATVDAVIDLLGKGLLDVLFIDADHTYDGVRSDLNKYAKFVDRGGVVLFHDIVETDFVKEQGAEVYKLWREIKASPGPFKLREFLHPSGDFGGIGALEVP